MGYTRYNYKPKKKPRGNFFTIGLVGIICAIVLGMLIAKYIFKDELFPTGEEGNPTIENDKDIKEKAPIEKTDDKKGTTTSSSKNFIMIQCGYYGKEENAKKALEEIPSEFNKFTIKDGDKYRIIAGVYNEEDGNKMSDELTKKDIVNVKIKCEYNGTDNGDAKTSEIIHGFMKILNELENDQVKSVNTTEFKKWTKELCEDSKGESKEKTEGEELKSVREHIEKLPEELDREGAKNSLEFIYKILIKHRV
ncbi:MAG: SPOR domain-containing protein [Clostridium sp.]|uniref:SPOR domain-containing protein n=1 Tax=Clostridium sp. TaxID=1506 RepID=UPI003F2EC462